MIDLAKILYFDYDFTRIAVINTLKTDFKTLDELIGHIEDYVVGNKDKLLVSLYEQGIRHPKELSKCTQLSEQDVIQRLFILYKFGQLKITRSENYIDEYTNPHLLYIINGYDRDRKRMRCKNSKMALRNSLLTNYDVNETLLDKTLLIRH